MKAKEVRQSFLDFFEKKGHKIVPSSPVIPQGDPTLLFTNAGMNQFKDVFLGIGKREYTRAADTQKCIRVSGKHNDLEEVGFDTYHHTFFEMLGNWSFGDYYKEEAIEWAFELLTKIWGLPKDRLFATVFRTDDEAFEIWKKFLPESRIFRFDEKDNFWEMGEVGPCGPCSEIHFDRTPDKSGASLVNAGNPDVIELWNLVFIQYNRNEDGTLTELPAKHVDTGMGLERAAAILQNKTSNYDTDLFSPLINKLEELSGKEYPKEVSHPHGISMRVIADHIRTLAFAIADGAYPSNEGRGYVLRRILRRASRFARNLGFREPVVFKLVPTLIEIMGEFFTELTTSKEIIERVIRSEEENFIQTLDRGIEKFEEIVEKQKQSNIYVIPGDLAFLLYDSFGFPLDLTQLMAREIGFVVDVDGFNKKMEEQKERSRQSAKFQNIEVFSFQQDWKTIFTGYDEFETAAKVLFVEENKIVTTHSPFYVESGGQVSDTGRIEIKERSYRVVDLLKVGDVIVHICESNIDAEPGDNAKLIVDISRRRDIMRNHSATHLLHEALVQVLGRHVRQSGSLVAPSYLRFDFNHFEKVSEEQLHQIEQIVNEKIFEALEVRTQIMSLDDARNKTKAKMFFGEKYGDIVRVVFMGDFCAELCGGTHVRNTNEIGIFKITSEQSIAAGIRRIEAVSGRGVYSFIYDLKKEIDNLKGSIFSLEESIKTLRKELHKYEKERIYTLVKQWIESAKTLDNFKVVAEEVSVQSLDELRDIAEIVRNAIGNSGIAFLFSPIEDKLYIACSVTDDLLSKYPAGKIVNLVAQKLGGKGGGKPHLATAGAKLSSDYREFIKDINNITSIFNLFN
ncbi:MAG: alanine--tRNA ligase [Ignavibacteria bacterium]|nr:alanine--tRNA ligase [Ignavibacteria bacterium]